MVIFDTLHATRNRKLSKNVENSSKIQVVDKMSLFFHKVLIVKEDADGDEALFIWTSLSPSVSKSCGYCKDVLAPPGLQLPSHRISKKVRKIRKPWIVTVLTASEPRVSILNCQLLFQVKGAWMWLRRERKPLVKPPFVCALPCTIPTNNPKARDMQFGFMLMQDVWPNPCTLLWEFILKSKYN